MASLVHPSPSHRVIDQIQARIEGLYDVQLELRVADFLVDNTTRRSLPGAQMQLPEQLFVRGASGAHQAPGEDVEVALYLDGDVLTALDQDDPIKRLHIGNLEAFCIVAEGISHFVFLAWRLGSGLDVTPLELELQAEVDKFCLAACLGAEQPQDNCKLSAVRLWRQLFVDYALQPGLSEQEAHRYRTASRAAGRITKGMLTGRPQPLASQYIVQQARMWCRRSLTDKLRPAPQT